MVCEGVGGEFLDGLSGLSKELLNIVSQMFDEREARQASMDVAGVKFLLAMIGLGIAGLGLAQLMVGLSSILCVDADLKYLLGLSSDIFEDENFLNRLKLLDGTGQYQFSDEFVAARDKWKDDNKKDKMREYFDRRIKEIEERNYFKEKMKELERFKEYGDYLKNNNYDRDKAYKELFEDWRNGLTKTGNDFYTRDTLEELGEGGIDLYELFDSIFGKFDEKYREEASQMKELLNELSKEWDNYLKEKEFWQNLRSEMNEDRVRLGLDAESSLDDLFEAKRLLEEGGKLLSDEERNFLKELEQEPGRYTNDLSKYFDLYEEKEKEIFQFYLKNNNFGNRNFDFVNEILKKKNKKIFTNLKYEKNFYKKIKEMQKKQTNILTREGPRRLRFWHFYRRDKMGLV